MISSGKYSHVELAFMIGAAVMAIGGIAELFLGVKAEGQSLENIAKPLTAQDATDRESGGRPAGAPATA